MRLRSLLYVPAHRADFLAKAPTRGADALILDLEDSVPPDHKAVARADLDHWIPALAGQGATVFVRVNADPDMQFDDAIAAVRAGASALVVPKVRRPGELDVLLQVIVRQGLPLVKFIAFIEDPAGLLSSREIAAQPSLLGIALGGEDFATALGAQPIPDVLRQPKLMVHYAAKANGIQSFGLLRSIADYTDTTALIAAVNEARAHGFDGATCVHPSAVDLLNTGFLPSEAEVA